ncbi:hypothetical protein D3C81_1435750 [compost metagenome]
MALRHVARARPRHAGVDDVEAVHAVHAQRVRNEVRIAGLDEAPGVARVDQQIHVIRAAAGLRHRLFGGADHVVQRPLALVEPVARLHLRLIELPADVGKRVLDVAVESGCAVTADLIQHGLVVHPAGCRKKGNAIDAHGWGLLVNAVGKRGSCRRVTWVDHRDQTADANHRRGANTDLTTEHHRIGQ